MVPHFKGYMYPTVFLDVYLISNEFIVENQWWMFFRNTESLLVFSWDASIFLHTYLPIILLFDCIVGLSSLIIDEYLF